MCPLRARQRMVSILTTMASGKQRTPIEGMRLAAHLVLDGEQHFARIRIDDVLEAIFVLVDFQCDEAELVETSIGTGEICDVDLSVVAIVRLLRRIGLAEMPVLL